MVGCRSRQTGKEGFRVLRMMSPPTEIRQQETGWEAAGDAGHFDFETVGGSLSSRAQQMGGDRV